MTTTLDTAGTTHVDLGRLSHLRREIHDETGVQVTFLAPDGRPLLGGDDAGPRLVALARAAGETGTQQTETFDGGVAAAWPLVRRQRMVAVAAAQVRTADTSTGRRLLASIVSNVRARLALGSIREESGALSEALGQSFEEISLLHNLGEVLCVTQPVASLLEHACDELRETIGSEAVAAHVPLAREKGPVTVVSGNLPVGWNALPELVETMLQGLGDEPHVLINNHCASDPVLSERAPGMERFVLVPLALPNSSTGGLVAINRQADEFGSPDAKLLRSVVNFVSMLIENQGLYRDLRALMLDLVRALASSIDAKDPYTCGHSERVAILCRKIARGMDLPEQQVEWAYLAGLLHDIGKIGTPERILCKKGALDGDERRVMQEHPVVGNRILQSIERLSPIRQAVYSHHERIDGSGYPKGLEGEAIPLLARIVGLADAFDAMTSNRPYRPMLPLEHVRAEIQANAGTQFDPTVVESLCSLDLVGLLATWSQVSLSQTPEPEAASCP